MVMKLNHSTLSEGEASLKSQLHAVLAWCALYTTLFYLTPPAFDMLRELDVQLLAPGRLFVMLIGHTPWQAGGILLLAGALLIVGKDYLLINNRLRHRVNAVIVGVVGLFTVVGLLSLLLPILFLLASFCHYETVRSLKLSCWEAHVTLYIFQSKNILSISATM